ncbi:hypothetical protein MFRU_015g01530 [Monilinia fructicola]|nr:hypothetical protein MFRU_015g01530 [Monilinia fructicola]
MHLPIFPLTLTLILSLTLPHAIAVPAPAPTPALSPDDLIPARAQGRVIARLALGPPARLPARQAPADDAPAPSSDIAPPRADGLVPFAGGGPVLGKFVKPSFTPGPSDNVLPFPNSVRRGGVQYRDRDWDQKHKRKHTPSNAFCPYPGTAYCCNPNPGTGGTLCRWNGDGHLAGCELVTGGESVCCGSLGCKGMEGLREPIGTV